MKLSTRSEVILLASLIGISAYRASLELDILNASLKHTQYWRALTRLQLIADYYILKTNPNYFENQKRRNAIMKKKKINSFIKFKRISNRSKVIGVVTAVSILGTIISVYDDVKKNDAETDALFDREELGDGIQQLVDAGEDLTDEVKEQFAEIVD